MDEQLLDAVMNASDAALTELIDAQALTLDTVEDLKNRSAAVYFERPAHALRLAQAAYRLGTRLPSPAPALGRWALANALLFADRYREASGHFATARADYLSAGLELDAARMGVGQVWALAYTGDFDAAFSLAASIEPVLATSAATDLTDQRRLGGLFNNLGILYDLLGRYEEALQAYDRKLAIARSLNHDLDVARTQHNRGCTLIFLNAFDEAQAALTEARTAFESAQVTADLARLEFNAGTLYTRWQRFSDAEAAFARAERWLASLENAEQARAVLIVYRELARRLNAASTSTINLDELAAARDALAQHGPPFEEALAELALSQVFLREQDDARARHALHRVLALADQGAGRPLAPIALQELGHLAEAIADPDRARVHYEQAIEQVEAMRRDLNVDAFRASFLADKLSVYQDLIQLHVAANRLADAFAVVERARSRVLADRLAERLTQELSTLSGESDTELVAALQSALARLDEWYRQIELDASNQRGEAWLPTAERSHLTAVRQLEAEVVALTRQLEQQRPQLSAWSTGKTATIEQIQANLRGATLIEFYLAQGYLHAFVIEAQALRHHARLMTAADARNLQQRLTAAIDRALDLAARYGLDLFGRYLPALVADVNTHLARLYDAVLQPVLQTLPADTPLILSPDGPLHGMPLHAAFDGQRYLIETRAVSYSPSATVLELSSSGRSQPYRSVIAGYSGQHLKHIEAEVNAVSDVLPEAECFREQAATTAMLLEQLPQARLVHLAAHAQFRLDQPMLSSIGLADRRLTLSEIARLPLKAELITLSGCETGVGQLRGADLISLAAGFLGAGAQSLVVSLWRVDDASTAELMRAFYRQLAQPRVDRARALQAAQLHLLELGRDPTNGHSAYCHPAFWAPFILMGDPGRHVT